MTYLHLKVHSVLVTSRGENCREKFCSPPGGSWPEVGVIANGITSPPSHHTPHSSTWMTLAALTFEEENFHELAEKKKIFVEKTLADCSLVSPPKDVMLPNFTEKTLANSYKTLKFTKVFSLESSRCMVLAFFSARGIAT